MDQSMANGISVRHPFRGLGYTATLNLLVKTVTLVNVGRSSPSGARELSAGDRVLARRRVPGLYVLHSDIQTESARPLADDT